MVSTIFYITLHLVQKIITSLQTNHTTAKILHTPVEMSSFDDVPFDYECISKPVKQLIPKQKMLHTLSAIQTSSG